jgi:hypothetical protein
MMMMARFVTCSSVAARLLVCVYCAVLCCVEMEHAQVRMLTRVFSYATVWRQGCCCVHCAVSAVM